MKTLEIDLTETRNEYIIRLINILTPLILEGFRSIFREAVQLCEENNESNKYLMTFQNFISRITKWNNTIIENESQRIKTESKCKYLEDLITCVHISQLKLLTNIRVTEKSQEIEVDIPKIDIFIHRIYIESGRRLYKNIYLFEKGIPPLQYQKNMREFELIIRESILNVIRESIPIESILKQYLHQKYEEEEEVSDGEEEVEDKTEDKTEDENKNDNEKNNEDENGVAIQDHKLLKTENTINVEKDKTVSIPTNDNNNDNIKIIGGDVGVGVGVGVGGGVGDVGGVGAVGVVSQGSENNENIQNDNQETIKINILSNGEIETQKVHTSEPNNNSTMVQSNQPTQQTELEKLQTLKFNDVDQVLENEKINEIQAPKDIETLEKISEENWQRRKEEEEEEDEEDRLQIYDDNVNLDFEELGNNVESDLDLDFEEL